MLGLDSEPHRAAQAALLGRNIAGTGLGEPRGPPVQVAFKAEAVAAELLA